MAKRIIRQELPVKGILASVPSRAARVRAWELAREKLVAQINALKALEPLHGAAWVEGQSRYWRKRLAEMDANKPK